MKKSLHDFLLTRFPTLPCDWLEHIANAVFDHICTPEFTALYTQRNPHIPKVGVCPVTDHDWRIAMSALTDALTALGKQIASLNPTANAAHFQAIEDHLTKLDSSEVIDAAAIKDTQDGLNALLAAASGASSGSGASSAAGASTTAKTA